MKTFTLFILLLCSVFAEGQVHGIIKAANTDSTAGTALPAATVSIRHSRDSSLVRYGFSDAKGRFEIKGLKSGAYLLIVSHKGFEDLSKKISITGTQKPADMGELILHQSYKILSAVVLNGTPPVRINGDTTSFNAGSFKTNPGASLEDLLKKLPGTQVEKDGTLKSMGENIQKLYVDGKEFFGNDPRVATKNLTADMVDQVQVFDDMSEQAKFTKIDDGSRSRAINIKLKKDKKKGNFGSISAGAGTDDRYEGNLSYNHFRDSRRISVVGSATNTNKPGYTFSEIPAGGTRFSQGGSGTGPGANAGAGNSAGMNESASAGINFTDQWGPKIEFRGSYHYSESENLLDQFSLKKYSYPGDSTATVNTWRDMWNKNKTHRFNARLEYVIDSLHSVLYTANLAAQESTSSNEDSAFTIASGLIEYLAVNGKGNKHDQRNDLNYGGELLFRRKFLVPGRTFTLGWRNGIGKNESENRISNLITSFDQPGTILHLFNLNSLNHQRSPVQNNTISASYTEPVGHNKLLEFNYAHALNKNISDKTAFDFNNISGKYDLLNIFQTNYFEYLTRSNRLGANFRSHKKNYNYQFGIAMQSGELNNRSIHVSTGKDSTISQRMINFFPTANFNYTFSRTKNIRFYYRGRSNTPSLSQLQDAEDISDPLHLRMGNPLLKQEFISNFSVNYSSFNIQSSRFFSANLGLNLTGNKISNSIDSAGMGIIITRPENMKGAYQASGMITLGFPIKKLPGSTVNFTTMAYYNRDISQVFKIKNFNTMLVINQSLAFNYNKERFDLGISGNMVYNLVKYDLLQNSINRYISQAWSADLSYRFKNHVFLLTDLDYYKTSGREQGFNQQSFIWNMAIAKKFLKDRTAELKLTAYDIFKQNKGINRMTGDNYYEDTRSIAVPRFFLLSFTYQLKQGSGKKHEKAKPASEGMMIFSN